MVNFILYAFNVIVTRVLNLCNKIIKTVKVFVIIFAGFLLEIAPNATFAEDLPEIITSLISSTEKEYNIPNGLLKAIAEVESQLNPYALNINGSSFFAKSKNEASKIISSYLEKGFESIDVGLMQVNVRWHSKNFANIEEMLVPKANIKYAAKLLAELYLKHGNWQKAVRFYHSAKPHYHNQYSRKVLLSWLYTR